MSELPLTAADCDRLGKLMGLFGSEHAGERAAAAKKADALVRDRGADWQAVANALRAPRPVDAHVPRAGRSGVMRASAARHIRTVYFLLSVGRISAWERDFLTSIRARDSLTERQETTLAAIKRRVDRERAA